MKTALKLWEERSKNLQEENSNLSSELQRLNLELDLLKKTQDSQPSQGNSQALRNESIAINLEVENEKRQLNEIKDKVVSNHEKLKEELKKEGSNRDNDLIKRLQEEKLELEKQLKEKEKELLKLQEERSVFEKNLTERCQKLQEEISKEEKELERKKQEIEKKTSVSEGIKKNIDRIVSGETKEKKLKELLDNLCELQEKLSKRKSELKTSEAILQNFNIKIITKLPNGINNNELEENTDYWNEGATQYHKIIPNEFLTKKFSDRKAKKDQLPTKLVEVGNFNINKLEETKIVETRSEKFEPNTDEVNYAILSYSWNTAPWSKFKKKEEISLADLMHNGSEKSLRKAIESCKQAVEVDYLWIDCLCMNQKKESELKSELAKVRKYYSNAKVTLIAIQTNLNEVQKGILGRFSANEDMEQLFSAGCEIISIIVNSEWFQRSWTFQEGLLSSQTIFMFDDVLIDGRFLAMVWSVKQNPTRMISQLNKKEERDDFLRCYGEKTTTPIGWSYYHNGYKKEDEVYLGLFQALEASKDRKRYNAIDSICSILGLLPYKVEDSFDLDTWGKTERSSDKKKEVLDLLTKVIKSATENGYGEPFSWYGESNDATGYCWLPKILDGSIDTTGNGSVNVEGIIENVRCSPKSVEFISEKGIKIKGAKYEITNLKENTDNIGGQLWSKKIWVKVGSSEKKIRLQGMEKSLNKIKINDSGKSHILLLIPNKTELKINQPIAFLATENGDGSYHREDLVRIIGELDSNNTEEDLIIGINNQKENQNLPEETNSHIEIPPKK